MPPAVRPFLTLLSVLPGLAACEGTSQRTELPPEVATPDRPAISPSGKYRLLVREEKENGSPTQRFDVTDAKGRLDYRSSDHFHERHATFFLWGDGDRVWVYSGDIGTYYWTKNSNGMWVKKDYNRSVMVPAFLRRVRPKNFSNKDDISNAL